MFKQEEIYLVKVYSSKPQISKEDILNSQWLETGNNEGIIYTKQIGDFWIATIKYCNIRWHEINLYYRAFKMPSDFREEIVWEVLDEGLYMAVNVEGQPVKIYLPRIDNTFNEADLALIDYFGLEENNGDIV